MDVYLFQTWVFIIDSLTGSVFDVPKGYPLGLDLLNLAVLRLSRAMPSSAFCFDCGFLILIAVVVGWLAQRTEGVIEPLSLLIPLEFMCSTCFAFAFWGSVRCKNE